MRSAFCHAPRRGLTVYEVFLALTLLLGALAVLSQHLSVGSRAGARARLQTQAAMYAETAMAEVVGGVYPLSPLSNTAVEGAPQGWTWSLQVAAGPTVDLLNLSVVVNHVSGTGTPDASFTLHRLVRDPQVLLDAAAAASEAAAASTTTSSSSSSGSGSGSSTSGSSGSTSSGSTGTGGR